MGDAWQGWRVMGAGVGVGLGAVVAWWAWRRTLTQPDAFTQWEEVGEVSQLIIYPLKSGSGVMVNEAEATRYGLARDLLEDRSFVCVTLKNQIIRGTDCLKLFAMTLTLEGSEVTLRAEGEEEALKLDLEDVVRAGKVIEVMDLKERIGKGYDCGEAAAAWLTGKVHPIAGFRDKMEVRLVYNGDLTRDRRPRMSSRIVSSNGGSYYSSFYRDYDRVVYGDHAPYILTSETSLASLNAQLKYAEDNLPSLPVTQEWFRPNVVVTGIGKAYDEDDWAFISVGNVVFRRLKPCDRCMNINSEKHDVRDILKYALHQSRRSEGARVVQNYRYHPPEFGSYLGIDKCGLLRVGDKVTVARASWNPRWRL